jgi:hypothetical protein
MDAMTECTCPEDVAAVLRFYLEGALECPFHNPPAPPPPTAAVALNDDAGLIRLLEAAVGPLTTTTHDIEGA